MLLRLYTFFFSFFKDKLLYLTKSHKSVQKKKLKRIPFFISTHSTRQNNASGHQIITNNPQYQFFYNIHLTIIVNKRHYIPNLHKRIRFNDEKKKLLKKPISRY